MSAGDERETDPAGRPVPARSMAELAGAFGQLAGDFTEHLHRARGHVADAPVPEALVVEPGQVLLIRLPSPAWREDVALFQRFVDDQCRARGITLPVLVVVGEVSAGAAPEGSALCRLACTGPRRSRRWPTATGRPARLPR